VHRAPLDGGERRAAVERATVQIDNAAEEPGADRGRERLAIASHLRPAPQSPRGVDGDGGDTRASDVGVHDGGDPVVRRPMAPEGGGESRDRTVDVDLQHGPVDRGDPPE
jgi:hypothetical protein